MRSSAVISSTELNLTTGKRQELERRLQQAQEEKESLTSSLEESSDRIHMLERHAREQETKLEVSQQQFLLGNGGGGGK